MKQTSIQINKTLLDRIIKLKIHRREPAQEVVQRILDKNI